MSWGGILKSETTIVNALTEQLVHGTDLAISESEVDN